jgi:hypothetical protein
MLLVHVAGHKPKGAAAAGIFTCLAPIVWHAVASIQHDKDIP